MADFLILAGFAGIVAYLWRGLWLDITARAAMRRRSNAERLQDVGILTATEVPADPVFRNQIRLNRYVAKRAGRRAWRVAA